MSKYYLFIIATVLLNATSQLLMKTGTGRVEQVTFAKGHIPSFLVSLTTQPLILLGLICMTVSMVTHLMALSRFDVSFAFPFLSIAYVIVAVYGYFVLGETMNAYRVAGIGAIVFGAFLIMRSSTA